MTWEELATDQRRAAELLQATHPRPSCSRAYYAAYSLLTSRLSGNQFSRGWNNPPHVQLRRLIDTIPNLTNHDRRSIKQAINSLRHRREDADYRPGITVDQRGSLQSLRELDLIRRIME